MSTQSSMQSLLPSFRTALQSFAASKSFLQILRTIPSSLHHLPPKTLYILDSSFNPPTRAHLRIAASALNEREPDAFPKRLLLLLATQNADKAPKPASFDQRLAMLSLFAEDLIRSLKAEVQQDNHVAIDIGITKLPYFIDKSAAISSYSLYQPDTTDNAVSPVQQVHLVGFDTIIRILNPKYYPPTHTLAPLAELFKHHSLRVTYRADDDWGGRKEQDEYIKDLREGKMEEKGGQREWVKKIRMVEGRQDGEEVISSTKVRNAVDKGDVDSMKTLCTEGVVNWLLEEKPYTET